MKSEELRAGLEPHLTNANVKAFLHMIRVGEGTADEDGYRRHFGGELFESFANHPHRTITAGLGGNRYSSSAAGAYQFLSRTWDECQQLLGLPDFSPASQDLAALFLIRRAGALELILKGEIQQAISKCAGIWASLPGSPYGQPTKTLNAALESYRVAGGVMREAGTPAPIETREPTMPLPILPILTAVLPTLIEAVPKLGKLFGSGSEVQQRNVAAAELAVQVVQEAVGARNAQEAAEMVANDPAVAQVARQAVDAAWGVLDEAGGGGIEGARKFDAAAMEHDGPWWQAFRSPSFWAMLLLLPLVYMIVASVIGILGPVLWSDDVRAALAGTIVGTIVGGIVGYYWGQTTSKNRTPAA